jgi:hypothetical protein
MRVLAVAAVALAVVSAAGVLARPSSGASAVAAACPRPSVPASATAWSAARNAFAADLSRIRRYLLEPTIPNQSRMYARVEAALFQYYSYQGGVLNANRGVVKGNFTYQFKTGSQCIVRATKTVSFQVLLTARFTSTNRERMSFARVAFVEMKVPRITRYIDPVTR